MTMNIALTELMDKWKSQYIHHKTVHLGGNGVHHSDPSLWDRMSPVTTPSIPLQLWLSGHILHRLLPANDQDHWVITKAKLFLPEEAGPLWLTTCLQANASSIQLHPTSFPSPFIGARPALVWRLQTYSCSLFPYLSINFLDIYFHLGACFLHDPN